MNKEKEDLISRILDHPSNHGRDLHTLRALRKTLQRKTIQELGDILNHLISGEALPDHFE